ncbi:MAG: hypothetical protein COB12_07445 [Flavobacterium sp.]|nr:MAG: hypothetical protein COB12_07445 [Flavobacterium sp.]
MKSTIKLILFTFTLLLNTSSILAQHIKIDKKTLSFLATEKNINIVFSYDGLVFNENNLPEKEYLIEISKKLKDSGKDNQVKGLMERYQTSKDSLWPHRFTTTLNNKLADYKNGAKFTINDSSARYTMRVNNSWMYFGYNVIATKWPAKAKLDITFYKTSHPDLIIYETTIDKALGTNNEVYNLDKWSKFNRVAKAYEKGAYKLAQAFKRIVD